MSECFSASQSEHLLGVFGRGQIERVPGAYPFIRHLFVRLGESRKMLVLVGLYCSLGWMSDRCS